MKLLSKRNGLFWYDLSPELVGQEGIIRSIYSYQGRKQFALKGPRKAAWYDKNQLTNNE